MHSKNMQKIQARDYIFVELGGERGKLLILVIAATIEKKNKDFAGGGHLLGLLHLFLRKKR